MSMMMLVDTPPPPPAFALPSSASQCQHPADRDPHQVTMMTTTTDNQNMSPPPHLMMYPSPDYHAYELLSPSVEEEEDEFMMFAFPPSNGVDQTPPPPPPRRVQFDERRNTKHPSATSYRTAEECNQIWYTNAELQQMRRTTSRYVKDITRIERSLQRPTPAHGNNAMNHSFPQVLLQVYDACCGTPPHQDMVTNASISSTQRYQFHLWMAIATDRWGLERQSVREIYYDKSSRKQANKRVVLEVQGIMKRTSSEKVFSEEERIHSIRQAAERISHPSRLFARLLGEAQHHAAVSSPPSSSALQGHLHSSRHGGKQQKTGATSTACPPDRRFYLV